MQLPLTEFGVNRATSDGMNVACKACLRDAQAERRRAQGRIPKKQGPEVERHQKWCASCDRVLDRAAFVSAPSRKDGISSYCRECSRAAVAKSYRKRRDAEGKPARRVAPPGEKWCPDCEKFLPRDRFYSNRANSDGLSAYCGDHQRARADETRQRLHGGSRNYHLKRRYGIGEAEFDEMFVDQSGLCAACGKKRAEHVDHDHDTNKVRGLLCFTCNVALGNVGDDIGILLDLVDYLEEFGCQAQLNPSQRSLLRSVRESLAPSPSGSEPPPPTSFPGPGEDTQAS
jgi:hypothetical protein